jgi:7-cyano-7-deazaguanine synthase
LIFVNYNQKSLGAELRSVKNLALELGCELEIIDLPWLGKISTSFINNDEKRDSELLNWYVPCRNMLFLILGLALAESKFIKENEENDVYIGIKYENIGFRDTTEKFLEKMNQLTEFTEKGKFEFKAPFIAMDKEDIIELGKKLGLRMENTFSCYVSDDKHCGNCSACKARKKGFKFSRVEDNTEYES